MNNFQLPELSQFAVGLMHIQLLHTSASLAINENWDPDVRDDMEMMLNRIVPEDVPFRHSCEGPDDMVSIIKIKIRPVGRFLKLVGHERQCPLPPKTWWGTPI